jgi:quercetin dioxygenase-like cupin family protein
MQSEKVESKFEKASVQETPRMVGSHSTELDIDKEIEELHCSPDWKGGLARKMLVRYPDLQIMLRAMKANTRIPEHHNPGRISVQTLRGHIRMHADGKLFDLPEGKVLILDRAVTHDVEAVEESAFLLTVALPESAGR